MTITSSMNTFIARAGGKIEIPKIPTQLIMDIIKIADGGKTTHERKMAHVLQSIKQTGGSTWARWGTPMEWLLVEGGYVPVEYGIEWEYVIDRPTSAWWLWELLGAERQRRRWWARGLLSYYD